MIIGIFWVFSYRGPHSLLGSIYDLYNVYDYFDKICDRLYIFTDIEYNENIRLIAENISKGFISMGYLRWFENINHSDKIIRTQSSEKIINGTINVLNSHPVESFIFYYSGHSESKKFIMPDMISYQYSSFLSGLTQVLPDTSKILLIIDSCHVGDFHMPYCMDNRGIFKMNGEIDYYPSHSILCISSTAESKKALNSNYGGSHFTRKLISHLKCSTDDLKFLAEIIDSGNIYSSRPDNSISWILHKKMIK